MKLEFVLNTVDIYAAIEKHGKVKVCEMCEISEELLDRVLAFDYSVPIGVYLLIAHKLNLKIEQLIYTRKF